MTLAKIGRKRDWWSVFSHRSPSNGVPYKGLCGKIRTRISGELREINCPEVLLCLCEISADFGEFRREGRPLRTGVKLAKISWNFAETQRKECTRLQVSLFQFISRYSPEIRVLILYHRNPIQILIWHPIPRASCGLAKDKLFLRVLRFSFLCCALILLPEPSGETAEYSWQESRYHAGEGVGEGGEREPARILLFLEFHPEWSV